MPNAVQLTENNQEIYPVTHESLVVGLNSRPYDSQSPNGMGYLVLEKDKAFASQVTDTNTIYEIRYDFNLGGSSKTIPSRCVLKFNGGKITNGTLVGQETKIFADTVQIFDDSISLTGSWGISDFFVEWFGAVGDGTTDDTIPIQSAFNSANQSSAKSQVRFLPKTYIITSPILTYGVRIFGNYDLTGNSTSTLKASPNFTYITIDGLKYNSMLLPQSETIIEDMFFKASGVCNVIQWIGAARGVVNRCKFYDYIIGIVFYISEDICFSNNQILNGDIGVRASRRKLDIDTDWHRPQTNMSNAGAPNIISFQNNYIDGNNIGVFVEGGSNVDFIHNSTGSCEMFAVLTYSCKDVSIRDGYSENDGTCFHDNIIDGYDNGTAPAISTSASLIAKNLDGMVMNGVHYHGIYCASACTNVIIEGNIISYKKRGHFTSGDDVIPQYKYGNFTFNRNDAGIDAIFLDMNNKEVTIRNNAHYNWNYQFREAASELGNDCVVYATISGKNANNDKYILSSIHIDKIYRHSVKFVEERIDCVPSPIGIECWNNYGLSLNTKLRFTENDYLSALNGHPNGYTKDNGKYFNELSVEYVTNERGIPLYRHSTTDPLFMCIPLADIEGLENLEVCRFIKPLSYTANWNALSVIKHYNTSGSSIADEESYCSMDPKGKVLDGDFILQRIVIRDPSIYASLRNIIVEMKAYPTGNISSAQSFLFSPPFIRIFGNNDVPDFNRYILVRNIGATSERPTLTSADIGFQYYDKTLKKYILWNGTAWVNMDGTALS